MVVSALDTFVQYMLTPSRRSGNHGHWAQGILLKSEGRRKPMPNLPFPWV